MSDKYNEYIGKKFIGVSIVLALAFWAVFTRMLLPFVPSYDPIVTYILAGFTAACLTWVFFIATHMFRLVKVEHAEAKRNQG